MTDQKRQRWSAHDPPTETSTRPVHAYDERLFQHFMAIDVKRAARAGRRLLLVRVSVESALDARPQLAPETATAMFTALSLCLRECDFMGWEQQETVAAAVLFQGQEATATDARRHIRDRVTQEMHMALPREVLSKLRIEVLALGAGTDRKDVTDL